MIELYTLVKLTDEDRWGCPYVFFCVLKA